MDNPDQVIIGRIPGYNTKIDAKHEFEKELLKGITFVDLYPTSYTDTMGLTREVSRGDFSPFGEQLKELFQSPGLVQSVPPAKSTTVNGADPSLELFQSVLKRMEGSFGISKGFSKKKSIRIIAANDSTFTEVFSNSYAGENAISTGYEAVKNTINSNFIPSQFLKTAKSFDSMAMQNILGFAHKNINDASGSSAFASLLSGAALGMNIGAPQLWSASQYNSTLTLFIKLISPTGQPECIRKNILEPLLYLVAASSPITAYGVVYGFPLMWQVHAHGITNFRIGSIAALSIIRGSFETTFTKALQPTVVDVRLTIMPLLTDFAVQTDLSGVSSIYDDDKAKYLGVQNPADIVRGTMNESAIGQKNAQPNIISVRI